MRRARAREIEEAAKLGRPTGIYTGLSERRRSSMHSFNDDSFGSRKNSIFSGSEDGDRRRDSMSHWDAFIDAISDSYSRILGCFSDYGRRSSESYVPPPPPIDVRATPPMGSPKRTRKQLNIEGSPPPAAPAEVAVVAVSGRRKSAFGNLGQIDMSKLAHSSAAQESKSTPAASTAGQSSDLYSKQQNESDDGVVDRVKLKRVSFTNDILSTFCLLRVLTILVLNLCRGHHSASAVTMVLEHRSILNFSMHSEYVGLILLVGTEYRVLNSSL